MDPKTRSSSQRETEKDFWPPRALTTLLAHASAAEKTLHGPNLVLVVRVQDIGLVARGPHFVDLHQVAGQLLADLRPEIGIEA